MEQEINQLISTKNTARIVGILFIIGTAAGITSGVLISPILDAPDYLVKISADQNRAITAALLLFIMGAACSSIAIWLYPVLKRYSESLALEAWLFQHNRKVLLLKNLFCSSFYA
jgi:hypothetical protein